MATADSMPPSHRTLWRGVRPRLRPLQGDRLGRRQAVRSLTRVFDEAGDGHPQELDGENPADPALRRGDRAADRDDRHRARSCRMSSSRAIPAT